jgi:transcriptional regulator with XRE-family HTH domain
LYVTIPIREFALPSPECSRSLARLIGSTIRDLRRRRGFNQANFARIGGTHRTYISRLECGNVLPSIATFVRLTAALGVSGWAFRLNSTTSASRGRTSSNDEIV